jgi:hypothetical protein
LYPIYLVHLTLIAFLNTHGVLPAVHAFVFADVSFLKSAIYLLIALVVVFCLSLAMGIALRAITRIPLPKKRPL